jgi:hypothetical protein
MEFARSVASQYSEVVTYDTYIQGWEKHKTQLTNFIARRDGAHSET